MVKTKKILVSDQGEAVEEAGGAFSDDPELVWVIAEGRATVGGVFFESRGALVLHRSERGKFTGRYSVEACQEEILATLS